MIRTFHTKRDGALTPELSCGAQWRRVVVDVTTKDGATKRHQLERLVRL